MALEQATKSRETTYTINDAMDVLLSKLDEWTGSISSIGGCGKTHRIYKKIIVTGCIQTDWVPPVFMSAENRWTAEEK